MLTMADLRARLPDGNPLIDLADIYDLNEILIVDAENQRRAQKAAERKAQRKARK